MTEKTLIKVNQLSGNSWPALFRSQNIGKSRNYQITCKFQLFALGVIEGITVTTAGKVYNLSYYLKQVVFIFIYLKVASWKFVV